MGLIKRFTLKTISCYLSKSDNRNKKMRLSINIKGNKFIFMASDIDGLVLDLTYCYRDNSEFSIAIRGSRYRLIVNKIDSFKALFGDV